MDRSELLGDSNPALSKLESIAAWRISPSAESLYAMMNAATSQRLAVLTGNTGPVHAVAFSPDGNVLVTGNDNGTAQLWDVTTRQPIGSPLNGGTGPVDSVAFSPDGKTLATGDRDGTVRLWDVTTRRQIRQPPQRGNPRGQLGGVQRRTARPSPWHRRSTTAMARYSCGTWRPAS